MKTNGALENKKTKNTARWHGKFDYSHLLGFIYGNKQIKNKLGFAKMIGMTPSGLCQKLLGDIAFSQVEIMKIKETFGLNAEQIDDFFFTAAKENFK